MMNPIANITRIPDALFMDGDAMDIDQICGRREIVRAHPKYEDTSRVLGKSFVPGEFDVICARGKSAWNHSGNKFFRSLVKKGSKRYGDAKTKLQRSIVVSEIVDAIRDKGTAGFVKREANGRWIEIGDYHSREKVGQVLRNACSSKYRSSTKSKRMIKQEKSPRLNNNCQRVLESSKEVSSIMQSLEHSAHQPGLSDREVLDMFNEANNQLLVAIKKDRCLVLKFHFAVNASVDCDVEAAGFRALEPTPMIESAFAA